MTISTRSTPSGRARRSEPPPSLAPPRPPRMPLRGGRVRLGDERAALELAAAASPPPPAEDEPRLQRLNRQLNESPSASSSFSRARGGSARNLGDRPITAPAARERAPPRRVAAAVLDPRGVRARDLGGARSMRRRGQARRRARSAARLRRARPLSAQLAAAGNHRRGPRARPPRRGFGRRCARVRIASWRLASPRASWEARFSFGVEASAEAGGAARRRSALAALAGGAPAPAATTRRVGFVARGDARVRAAAEAVAATMPTTPAARGDRPRRREAPFAAAATRPPRRSRSACCASATSAAPRAVGAGARVERRGRAPGLVIAAALLGGVDCSRARALLRRHSRPSSSAAACRRRRARPRASIASRRGGARARGRLGAELAAPLERRLRRARSPPARRGSPVLPMVAGPRRGVQRLHRLRQNR